MVKVIGWTVRYSEIGARLKVVEQTLNHMSRQPNNVKTSSDVALSLSRNVVIHGVLESFMKGGVE